MAHKTSGSRIRKKKQAVLKEVLPHGQPAHGTNIDSGEETKTAVGMRQDE